MSARHRVRSQELQRHAWNRDFQWEDRTGPFRSLTADQVRSYDEDGFLVLPDLLPTELVDRARNEIDLAESELEAALRALPGERVAIAEAGAITFTTHLAARSDTLRALTEHDRLLDLCHDLIGPDVNLYWDQAVYKKPERPRRFPWHQDNGYAFVEPQQYLTCWIALTDATLRSGCPQVASGLHRMGTLAHRYVDPLGFECLSDPGRVVVAEVPAGGAVVFSSLTPHLTGPNTTDAVRKAYIVQYAPAGAEVLHGDPAAGPPSHSEPCDDPARQYPVLRHGQPAAG